MSESRVLLEESWQTLRSRVDTRLGEYMQQSPDCPPELRESITYSLLGGGKRLRPVLVLLACEACGGDVEAALPAACAIEMVHTYSLIHDDLPAMDDDDLRRGQATNHVVFGEALAILAGDGLLTLAFEVLARDVQPPEVAAACCADLASAAGVKGMVGGQVADLAAEDVRSVVGQAFPPATADRQAGNSAAVNRQAGKPAPHSVDAIEQLEAIHRRKTGRLLCSALTLGARIARADPETIHALNRYGQCVGLAFQIADDLLDISGDADKMGKEVRKDADHGKLTYPALLGEQKSRQRAGELIEEACRWIAPLSERGRRLETLAEFVIERDH